MNPLFYTVCLNQTTSVMLLHCLCAKPLRADRAEAAGCISPPSIEGMFRLVIHANEVK